ncbi:MAG: alpha/beta fold hydrolase [Burkholderiales bacterium]
MKRGEVLCLGSSGFHRMHYYDWGDVDNPRVLICVHGLTRTGRDFDFLAQSLEREYRIICPDIVGRGASDWLEAKSDYGYVQYMNDMTALIARVSARVDRTIDWLGTSMGALVGMMLASRPRTPIRKLILNDAGVHIPKAALERLAQHVGRDPRFATLEALEAYLRFVSAPFGPLTDAQWRHLTVHSAKQHPDGSWGLRYDPAIRAPFDRELADIDLSVYWDAIRCPTLVIRGSESDLLLKETAAAMTTRGPNARVVEIEGVGHAPMLMTAEEIAIVREFLLEGA